jgi:hypothetical protein
MAWRMFFFSATSSGSVVALVSLGTSIAFVSDSILSGFHHDFRLGIQAREARLKCIFVCRIPIVFRYELYKYRLIRFQRCYYSLGEYSDVLSDAEEALHGIHRGGSWLRPPGVDLREAIRAPCVSQEQR